MLIERCRHATSTYFPRRSYWLRRLENRPQGTRASVEYTIEHIMPQNENLSAAWRDLGPEWKQVLTRWLHTLGNLTLTG